MWSEVHEEHVLNEWEHGEPDQSLLVRFVPLVPASAGMHAKDASPESM